MGLAALQSVSGASPDLLLAVPALLLLPLLVGRYVGEDGLARLARRALAAPCGRPRCSALAAARAPARRAAHRRRARGARAAGPRRRAIVAGHGRCARRSPTDRHRPCRGSAHVTSPCRRRRCSAATLLVAPAAQAYQGNPNYRSVIEGIVPNAPGVKLQVLNFDDRLQLDNRTGKTITIDGYQHEPYARLLSDGTVEVNRNSPAPYLNNDRTSTGTVPPNAKPGRRRTGSSSTGRGHSSGTTTASTG